MQRLLLSGGGEEGEGGGGGADLEDVPFDDRPAGVLQRLLPVLEPGLVLLILAPAKLDLSNGVAASDEIVVTDLGLVLGMFQEVT